MQQSSKDKMILNFFILFIIFQPIIDVFTTFTNQTLNSSISFGILIRCVYLVLGVVFILSQFNKLKLAKIITIYLVVLGVFVVGNLFISYMHKPVFHLTAEVIFFTKLLYGNIVMLNFVLVFKYLKEKPEKFLKQFLNGFVYSAIIIGGVMVISYITSTSITTYEWNKIGFTGWFYAGNELGAILAILSPVALYYAIKNTKHFKHLYYWIPFLSMALSLIMVGTKVGYGALVITLVMSVLSLVITYFISKDKSKLKGLGINTLITSLLLVVLIVSTPLLPIYKNTFAHMDLLGIDYANPKAGDSEEIDPNTGKPSKYKTEISTEQYENLIFSSRDLFVKVQQEYFAKAPMTQKIFGMGFAGNYPDKAKMIEMDFHDVFFSLGIFGFTLYFAPYLLFGGLLIVIFLKNFRCIFMPKYALFISSILLALGISATAGHVLTAPAVSIYVSAIIAFLVTLPPNKDELL